MSEEGFILNRTNILFDLSEFSGFRKVFYDRFGKGENSLFQKGKYLLRKMQKNISKYAKPKKTVST